MTKISFYLINIYPINADIFERVSNLCERVESKKFPKCLI